jgi:hypothetical protein
MTPRETIEEGCIPCSLLRSVLPILGQSFVESKTTETPFQGTLLAN